MITYYNNVFNFCSLKTEYFDKANYGFSFVELSVDFMKNEMTLIENRPQRGNCGNVHPSSSFGDMVRKLF